MHADLANPALLLEGVVAADGSEALYRLAALDHTLTWPPGRVTLPGLDPERAYAVSAQAPGDGAVRGAAGAPGWSAAGVTMTGRVLAEVGLQAPLLAVDQLVLIRARAVALMPTYAAFLRAINLGAKRKFPKDAIKAAVEAAGGTDVETYINTGNVRLTTSLRSRAKVEAALEKAFHADRGFEVPTMVFTLAELADVAAYAEQLRAEHGEPKAHYVALFKDAPTAAAVRALAEAEFHGGAGLRRGPGRPRAAVPAVQREQAVHQQGLRRARHGHLPQPDRGPRARGEVGLARVRDRHPLEGPDGA